MIFMEQNKYKVVDAKRPVVGGFKDMWYIEKNGVLLYELNQWLEGYSKLSTIKRYAYAWISYLKYLDLFNIKYKDVTGPDRIYSYIKNLLFGDEGNLVNFEPQLCSKSIRGNISAIKSFYNKLDDEKYHKILSEDFLETIEEELKFKPSRYYIKWYSKEQIEVLAFNFKSLRDKIIFLISIEGGCRIDEILSIRYSDYDGINNEIKVSKSKTFTRTVQLPNYLCREIDRYIITERQKVEVELGLLDDLFINLRKGEGYGKRVSYSNYDRILKSTAKRAGFSEKQIVTHSSRRTNVQNLLDEQTLNPISGITEKLGWSNISTIKYYKKSVSAKVGKMIVDEKIKKRSIEKPREKGRNV